MKATSKNYETLSYKYDPWKEQLVFNLSNGGEMVLELVRDGESREFYLFGNEEIIATGIDSINTKVEQMIANKEISNIYIDSL